MTDGHKNLMTQLRMHSNGMLRHVVSQMSSLTSVNLTETADSNMIDVSNEICEPNHSTFFESSTENVEKSNNNSLMTPENLDFQRANDLSVLLKYWFDGDENEGIIRPLSTLTASEKKMYPECQTGTLDTKSSRTSMKDAVVRKATIMEKVIFTMCTKIL